MALGRTLQGQQHAVGRSAAVSVFLRCFADLFGETRPVPRAARPLKTNEFKAVGPSGGTALSVHANLKRQVREADSA